MENLVYELLILKYLNSDIKDLIKDLYEECRFPLYKNQSITQIDTLQIKPRLISTLYMICTEDPEPVNLHFKLFNQYLNRYYYNREESYYFLSLFNQDEISKYKLYDFLIKKELSSNDLIKAFNCIPFLSLYEGKMICKYSSTYKYFIHLNSYLNKDLSNKNYPYYYTTQRYINEMMATIKEDKYLTINDVNYILSFTSISIVLCLLSKKEYNLPKELVDFIYQVKIDTLLNIQDSERCHVHQLEQE